MQSKNISLKIQSKMEDWLESITDKKLRSKVKENLLVSGGCIASMLLNEKVHDYDVYIQDMDVLLDLVKYYVDPYLGSIEIWDGRKKDELYDVFDFINEDDDRVENGKSISFRNLKSDQIKLYICSGKGGYDVVSEKLKNEEYEIKDESEKKLDDLKYQPLYLSPNAITLSDGVQIVIRFWGDHEQIHKNYDFIHATNYFTMSDKLVTNTKALESILAKQLYYQGSLYPITSIIRMRKFMKREWNINAGDILKILFQVSQLDLTNVDVLEEQLIGVDVFYFKKIIDELRDFHKGNKITSSDINDVIDKVFNSVIEDDNEKF